MKLVLAFDSFKGCLSSSKIIDIATHAIKNIIPQARICGFIIADGGEGTIDALVSGLNGSVIGSQFSNLEGIVQSANIGIINNQCILECAQTVGLVQSDRMQVELKTTHGLGEQIKFALDLGYRQFVVGLGGSGTNDAGIGMLEELGYSFLDSNGNLIDGLLKNISQIMTIDASNVDSRLVESSFTVLSDVNNPLYGSNGASYIYGPQKGIMPEQLADFDYGIMQFSQVAASHFGFDKSCLSGSGAAGGLGYAFLQFLNARLVSGVEHILSALNVAEEIADADLVLTGEGRSDAQTAQGKVAIGVAKIAKQSSTPVLLISGALSAEAYQLHQFGIDFMSSIQDYPAEIEYVMQPEIAEKLLLQRVEEIMRLLLIGQKLSLLTS